MARPQRRTVSGPKGLTSTGRIGADSETRTLCNARAALEGEGVAKQGLWLTHQADAKSYLVPPGKNATTKDSTFRGKAITYPGPLARSGAATTPVATDPPIPSTTWVPPPLADLPAAVASTN